MKTRSQSSKSDGYEPYASRVHTLNSGVICNWDDILERRPRASGYAIQEEYHDHVRTVNYGDNNNPKNEEVGVYYRGVDHQGRNLGLWAIVDRTSHSPNGFMGEYATGEFEYFQAKHRKGTASIHRGHLLARSLNGIGSRLNWVPLKGSSNLAEWSALESIIFDHINDYAVDNAWAEIRIVVQYAETIPIPTDITYHYKLYRKGHNGRARLVKKNKRRITNDLRGDFISTALTNAWA